MQTMYEVDATKRKECIKRVIAKHPDKSKIHICNILSGIVYAFMIVVGIVIIYVGFYVSIEEDLEGKLLFLVATILSLVIAEAILWLFPIYTQRFRNARYLKEYYGKKMESVTFTTNTLVWGEWSYMGERHRSADKPYWERMIRYKDIKRVEYDDIQEVFRVYGLAEKKMWEGPKVRFIEEETSEEYVRLAKKIHKEYMLDFPAFQFPNYFNDNGEMMNLFSEKLGDRFVKKHRPYNEYTKLKKQKEKERKEKYGK